MSRRTCPEYRCESPSSAAVCSRAPPSPSPVPLALVGDRSAVYTAAGPPRLVHDWLWRRRGPGVVVSWLLLKRLNLVAPR